MRDIEYIDMKHRIVDNHKYCYPQYKGWIFWHNYVDPDTGLKIKFLYKNIARDFILYKLYRR